MAWDESEHPRDGDGRFSENPHERDEKKRDAVRHIYDSDSPNGEVDSYRLPDEQLPKSVGAKWANYEVLLPDGSAARFVEGTKLQDKEVFAGKGCKRKIDCVDRLVGMYGGNPSEWKKVKANATIELPDGEIIEAEVHWYEETTAGKHRFKVKRYSNES